MNEASVTILIEKNMFKDFSTQTFLESSMKLNRLEVSVQSNSRGDVKCDR